MLFETNREKDRAGMSLAIAYFGSNGYTVSIPLNDTQWYDLIVEKDKNFYTVQCKATGSKDNVIQFRSSGGTNGSTYDNILNHPELDYIFCLDKDKNMYLFPFKNLVKSGNTNSVTLRTEPNKNNQGFPSYKYIVQL